MKCLSSCVWLLTLWLAPHSLAHGDLSDRIAGLSARIADAPDATALLLARGDLYVQHGDHAEALTDYAAVRRAAPQTAELDLRVARAQLGSGDALGALPSLIRRLGAQPDDPMGLLLRARACAALGYWLPAAADYRRLLAVVERPSAELYIAHADALLRAGPRYEGAAFATLEDGMTRLGPLPGLVHAALDAAGERGRHERVLAWLQRLPPAAVNQPQWLLREAEALLALHRDADALAALQQARATARALPPTRRATPAHHALERRVDHLLAALDAPR